VQTLAEVLEDRKKDGAAEAPQTLLRNAVE
jgi:hypothetical protein